MTKPRKNLKHLKLASIVSVILLVALAQSLALAADNNEASNNVEEATTANSSDLPTSASSEASPADSTQPPKVGKPYIEPVNYTLVDELFAVTLNDSVVQAKWTAMDKKLLTSVQALLKIIVPHIVGMSSDAKVSGNCSGAILKWILNLRNLRSWAVKMLDAVGKPSSGILQGSLTMFGNYKQCLAVRAPDEDEIELNDGEFREYFRGQYCVLQLKPHLPAKTNFLNLKASYDWLSKKSASLKSYEKSVYDELTELAPAFHFVNIRADLCMPSLCSRDDIQRVADFLSKSVDMRAKVLRCDVDTSPLPEDAATGPSPLMQLVDVSHVAYGTIFLAIIVIVLCSTLVSWLYNSQDKTVKSKRQSLLTSMSLYKSLAYVKTVQLERIALKKPTFLYAIRLLIVFWIFIVSLVNDLNFQYLRDLLPLRDMIMLNWPLQLIVNSSLAYESLIFLTAFTYSYQNIVNSSNVKDLVKYCATKYSRLMPAIMLLVFLTLLWPLLYINKSPIWHDFVDKQSTNCKSTGLLNILFLQNFSGNYSDMCIPSSWLFCVEFQLCLLALPLVLGLSRQFDINHGKLKLTSTPVLCLALVAILGCIINFYTVYANSLPAAWFLTYPDKQDKDLYYSLAIIKPWNHLTTFAFGLFGGYLCRCKSIDTFSGRPYGRSLVNKLMLLTAFSLMTTLIFSLHSYSLKQASHLTRPVFSALYATMAPLLWSTSLILILFYLTVPNSKNQYPAASQLLACNDNIIRLGRLSFCALLINPYINTFVYAIQETAIFSSIVMLFHTFIGNVTLTFISAFLMSIFIELPCRKLAKKLIIGSKTYSSNFDIIARQINIRDRNDGPCHDAYSASHRLDMTQMDNDQNELQASNKMQPTNALQMKLTSVSNSVDQQSRKMSQMDR